MPLRAENINNFETYTKNYVYEKFSTHPIYGARPQYLCS